MFDSHQILDVSAVGTECVGMPGGVTMDSKFHVGSLTKSMTATIAARLVELNVVDWQTTIAETFPGQVSERSHPYAEVTLRDLLMHRGGFAPWWGEEEFTVEELVPGLHGSPEIQRRTFVEWLLRQPEYAPPGEIQYSNAGYVVAAAILEQASGGSWEVLVNTHLFGPLGLHSVGFGWPRDSDGYGPCGHTRAPGSGPRIAHPGFHRLPVVFAPSGDLHMSIQDLARYGQMHLRGLHGLDGLVPARVFRFLHTPRGDYAMGWGVGESAWGERGSSHEGSAGTFFAALSMSHDRDFGLAILVNEGSEQARAASGNAALELIPPKGFLSKRR
jgi:CubicO group peptidase (beta-lactamase class C family)